MIGVRLAVAAAAALFALAAPAQPYPAKTVRILVGFAPGGGTDIMARAVGAKLTESVKQQFVDRQPPGRQRAISRRSSLPKRRRTATRYSSCRSRTS